MCMHAYMHACMVKSSLSGSAKSRIMHGSQEKKLKKLISGVRTYVICQMNAIQTGKDLDSDRRPSSSGHARTHARTNARTHVIAQQKGNQIFRHG